MTYLADDLSNRNIDMYAQTKFELVANILKKYQVQNILDVGCGTGELALYLAEKGYTVTGIDMHEQFIQSAQNNKQKKQLPTLPQFITADITRFKTTTQYDCVVSTDVLEHIEDDEAAIKNMLKALKPRGIIIIIVPALQSLYGFHDTQIGHYRRYTKKTLKDRVHLYIEMQSLRYFGWTMLPVVLLYRKSRY
jgi:ubiquinone biosynthesis O-methyltransferase